MSDTPVVPSRPHVPSHRPAKSASPTEKSPSDSSAESAIPVVPQRPAASTAAIDDSFEFEQTQVPSDGPPVAIPQRPKSRPSKKDVSDTAPTHPDDSTESVEGTDEPADTPDESTEPTEPTESTVHVESSAEPDKSVEPEATTGLVSADLDATSDLAESSLAEPSQPLEASEKSITSSELDTTDAIPVIPSRPSQRPLASPSPALEPTQAAISPEPSVEPTTTPVVPVIPSRPRKSEPSAESPVPFVDSPSIPSVPASRPARVSAEPSAEPEEVPAPKEEPEKSSKEEALEEVTTTESSPKTVTLEDELPSIPSRPASRPVRQSSSEAEPLDKSEEHEQKGPETSTSQEAPLSVPPRPASRPVRSVPDDQHEEVPESAKEVSEPKESNEDIPVAVTEPEKQVESSNEASSPPKVPLRPSHRPVVPVRPAKIVSADKDVSEPVAVPPRPKPKSAAVSSRVGALRASLFNDLQHVMGRPAPPGAFISKLAEPEEAEEGKKDAEPVSASQSAPTSSDPRRSRAKGPKGRRLPTSAQTTWNTVVDHVWSKAAPEPEPEAAIVDSQRSGEIDAEPAKSDVTKEIDEDQEAEGPNVSQETVTMENESKPNVTSTPLKGRDISFDLMSDMTPESQRGSPLLGPNSGEDILADTSQGFESSPQKLRIDTAVGRVKGADSPSAIPAAVRSRLGGQPESPSTPEKHVKRVVSYELMSDMTPESQRNSPLLKSIGGEEIMADAEPSPLATQLSTPFSAQPTEHQIGSKQEDEDEEVPITPIPRRVRAAPSFELMSDMTPESQRNSPLLKSIGGEEIMADSEPSPLATQLTTQFSESVSTESKPKVTEDEDEEVPITPIPRRVRTARSFELMSDMTPESQRNSPLLKTTGGDEIMADTDL